MPSDIAPLDGLVMRALLTNIPIVAASWLAAWQDRKVWKNERPESNDYLVHFQDKNGEIITFDRWKIAAPFRSQDLLENYKFVFRHGKIGSGTIPYLNDVMFAAKEVGGNILETPWTSKIDAKKSADTAAWDIHDGRTTVVVLRTLEETDDILAEGYTIATIERLLWHIFDPEMDPLIQGMPAKRETRAANDQTKQETPKVSQDEDGDTTSIETGKSLQLRPVTEIDHFIAATPSGSPNKKNPGKTGAASGAGASGSGNKKGTSRATRSRPSLDRAEPGISPAVKGTIPDSAEPPSASIAAPSVSNNDRRQTRGGASPASKRKQPSISVVSPLEKTQEGKDGDGVRVQKGEETPVSKRQRTKAAAAGGGGGAGAPIGAPEPSPKAPDSSKGGTSARKRGRQSFQAVQDEGKPVQQPKVQLPNTTKGTADLDHTRDAVGTARPSSKDDRRVSTIQPTPIKYSTTLIEGWHHVHRAKKPTSASTESESPMKHADQRKRRRRSSGGATLKQEPKAAAHTSYQEPAHGNAEATTAIDAAGDGDGEGIQNDGGGPVGEPSHPDGATTAAAGAPIPLLVDAGAIVFDENLIVIAPQHLTEAPAENIAGRPTSAAAAGVYSSAGGFKAFKRKGDAARGYSSRLPKISFDVEPYREEKAIDNDDFLREERERVAKMQKAKEADKLFDAKITVKRDKASLDAGNDRLLAMLPPETRRKLEAAKIAAAAKEAGEGKPAAPGGRGQKKAVAPRKPAAKKRGAK